MATVLIRGTNDDSNRADRISVALACTAYLRFNKRVVVLPLSTKFDLVDLLNGKNTKSTSIRSRGYSFDDNGIDALVRRLEQGKITAESFSDCCNSFSKAQNSFDVAATSKKPDLNEVIISDADVYKRLIQSAQENYDLVIVLADTENQETLNVLEKMVETEITVVSQGNKESFNARKDTIFAINNYDGSSEFTYKRMKSLYGLSGDSKLYSIPYNIRFKDSCRTSSALEFLSSNVKPDQTDDNYVFTECITRLVEAVLGMEAPLIQERRFATKERPKRR